MALSTCEAEINAAVTAAKDAIHLRRPLQDLDAGEYSKVRLLDEHCSATKILK